MGLRIFMAGAVLATLGGCGEGDGNSQAANDRGPTTTSAVAASGNAPTDCSKLPDFVTLYADARIETCVSGPGAEPGRESGTVIYTTGALPEAIVAWYKDKAQIDGLVGIPETETMFAAREDGKRSIMVVIGRADNATKVTVNWGRTI